ncbi:MAG: hypothetical protein IJJ82_05970 [Clostridia bacterium]|nr:hypothetical protein [Clostridia bacterium]
MSLKIEIQKKPNNKIERIKVTEPEHVYNLKEVQEIKDAIQEHLLLVGLDGKNNIRDVSLIGVGTGNHVEVDEKFIIRTALVSASEKVILVHNHPSNELTPSKFDIELSNIVNKLLDVFNIKFIDHIIVGEDKYLSMGAENVINRNYKNEDILFLENELLKEENNKLKEQIKKLNLKINKSKIKEEEDEFE